jgi:membrane protein required for colicin V production
MDLILVVMLVIGMASGYQKGFLTTLFSLLAIFLGLLAGFKLMGYAMLKLSQNYAIDEKLLPYAAFGIVFVLVLLVVNMLGKLLRSSLEKTLLGSVDNFAGAILGLLKAAFMISVVFWILDASGVKFFARWTEDSWLYPYIAGIAPAVTEWMGDLIPAFGDLFQS